MKTVLWGTRGSIPSPGPETARYGGNTSCVEVLGVEGTVLVLDAGSGLRRLGMSLPHTVGRIDILLTHLHLDHIQGLGFFSPLFTPDREVHIWGPAATPIELGNRLTRYLSPPLFPVRLRDLACDLRLHAVPQGKFEIGEFTISAELVCHPGITVGYRISDGRRTMTYLPDHEPALGVPRFPIAADWTSGYKLAEGSDLLIHDSQYDLPEYLERIGWGHSSLYDTLRFGGLVGARHVVPFHHDPAHDDKTLDGMIMRAIDQMRPSFEVSPGCEGMVFKL